MSTTLESVPVGRGEMVRATGTPQRWPRLSAVAAFMPALIAFAIWGLSLGHVDTSHLNSYGLPPALPISWYAALLLSLLGVSWTLSSKTVKPWLVIAYIVVIAAILYGSIAVISAQPHYSWAYKHFGVTRFLEIH